MKGQGRNSEPPAPSFEDRLKRLEEIVQKLEKGDVALSLTLEMFEEGRDLTRALTKELDDAERTIEILVKEADGAVTTEPFRPQEVSGEGSDES